MSPGPSPQGRIRCRSLRLRCGVLGLVLLAPNFACAPPHSADDPIPAAADPQLDARRAAAARTLFDLGLPDASRRALESIAADRHTAASLLDLARARSAPGDDPSAARVALDAATRFPEVAKEALLDALTYQERAWDLAGAVATLERLRQDHRLTSTERERVDGVRARLQALAGKATTVDQTWSEPDRWPFRTSDPFLTEFDRARGIAILSKGPGREPRLRLEAHATGTALEWTGGIALNRLDPGAAVEVAFLPPEGAEGAPSGGIRFILGSRSGTLSAPVARVEVDPPFQTLRLEPAHAALRADRYRLRFRVVRTTGAGTAAAIEAALLEAEESRHVLSVRAVDPAGLLANGLGVAIGGADACEEGSLFRVSVGGVRAVAIGGEWRGIRRGSGPEAPLEEGVRLLAEGKWPEALSTLGRIRHGTTDSAHATFLSALAAARAGQAAKAEGLLKEALGKDAALHRRAYYYLRWDRGFAGLLGPAVGREAAAGLLVRAAGESAAAGHLEAAIGDLDAALLTSPGHLRAREARADLLAALGRTEAALADAREWAGEPASAPGLLHLRADLLRLAGRTADALADLERLSAATGGGVPDPYLRGLVHLRAGEVAKAREDAQEAIRLDPRGARPYWLFALTHLQSGDSGAAEVENNRALLFDPWDGRAQALRGLLHALRRNPEPARSSLRISAGLAPDDPDALALRARAWSILGAPEERAALQKDLEARVPGGIDWLAPR